MQDILSDDKRIQTVRTWNYLSTLRTTKLRVARERSIKAECDLREQKRALSRSAIFPGAVR